MSIINGFNPSYFFANNNNSQNDIVVPDEILDEAPKRRGRPPKAKVNSNIATEQGTTDLTMMQSNVPYYNSFAETNDMIKGSIYQLDSLNNEVSQQINTIKESKTIKNKYNYLSNLAEVSSGIISSKITAIKEINNVIKTCHDLELKRTKELNLNASDKSDDQKLMEMYNAYISTPVGANPYAFSPSPTDMVVPGGSTVNPMNVAAMEQQIANQYMNNMSPEQNRMLQMENPNIKTVVVYDQATGSRWFDNIDVVTGESIPNMPIPDSSFLDDTTVNLKSGTARNSNINTDYPLIIVNGNGVAPRTDMSKF
jgi:hypothetical protein